MTLSRSALLVSLALSCSSLTQAQTLWALEVAPTGAPPVIVHETDTNCTPIMRCAPPSLGAIAGTVVPPGGIAYGTCTQTLWSTDGFRLEQTDLACNSLFVCPTGATPNNPWTGLAIDEDSNRLVHTDGFLIVERPIPNTCPLPPPTMRCQVGAPFAPPITGVEIDPFDGSFWICDVQGNVGKVAYSATGACNTMAFFPAMCPTGAPPALPLLGITLEKCPLLSTGVVVPYDVVVVDRAGTLFRMTATGMPLSCCTYPGLSTTTSTIRGLARRPRQPRTYGNPCTGGSCPTCVPTIGTRGDAVTPTNCFGVRLNNAPGGSFAWLMLDIVPISVPFACGTLLVNPGIVLPYGSVGGTPGLCDGAAGIPLPIASNPAFCGATFYFQWLMFCPPSGIGLSEGMQVMIN
ncbi:MAG: hypothetical protein H6834_12420 [Planctomycetes bacterium]|nr:hypothetical protein [Planctomycetota bacterium]